MEDRKTQLLRELDTIVAVAKARDRELTETEAGRCDAITNELDEMNSAIAKPKTLPTGPVVEHHREGSLDDPRRGFGTLADFASAVFLDGAPAGARDRRLNLLAAASGMEQGSASAGGYAAPPAFSNEIYTAMQEIPADLVSKVDLKTVEGSSLTFPCAAETSRATGSRWGGCRGYWGAEASQMTSSTPKLREVKLEPQELYVFTYATNKVLRNSGGVVEAFLTKAATEEISFTAGAAIFKGDGVGKPSGLLNSNCKISVSRDTASEFKLVDVAAMWARLHPRSEATAVWAIDKSVDAQLFNLHSEVRNVAATENVGGYSQNVYDPANNTLLGRPIIKHEYGEALGTEGDIVLFDPLGYVAGVHGSVENAMSIHLRFDYNESAFRWVWQLDGQTWLNNAITPFSGGSTLSTVVTLT